MFLPGSALGVALLGTLGVSLDVTSSFGKLLSFPPSQGGFEHPCEIVGVQIRSWGLMEGLFKKRLETGGSRVEAQGTDHGLAALQCGSIGSFVHSFTHSINQCWLPQPVL